MPKFRALRRESVCRFFSETFFSALKQQGSVTVINSILEEGRLFCQTLERSLEPFSDCTCCTRGSYRAISRQDGDKAPSPLPLPPCIMASLACNGKHFSGRNSDARPVASGTPPGACPADTISQSSVTDTSRAFRLRKLGKARPDERLRNGPFTERCSFRHQILRVEDS